MSYKGIYEEAFRLLRICNACRYCEGICPVWTVIEFRTDFGEEDVDYIANLCHHCTTCYYVCPYSPPHELNLNPSRTFSIIRSISYLKYSPQRFKKIYEKPIISAIILQVVGVMLALLVALYNLGFDVNSLFLVSRYYDVFPYNQIYVGGFVLVVYVIIAFLYQGTRFVKGIGGFSSSFTRSLLLALRDALFHTWFRDGMLSCGYSGESYCMLKRLFWAPHAMIMYGMLLLVIATIAAAVYKNVLGILSPYPLYSIPVLLGVTGGVLTFLGVLVVLQDYRGSEVELRVEEEKYLNLALIITIALPVITGLLTLTLRTTNLMGLIYTIHMGTVIGFFLYIPFSKLNHAIFRYLALAKYHSELLSHELGNKTH